MKKKISAGDIKKVVKQCFSEEVSRISSTFKGYTNKLCEIKLRTGKELMLRMYNESWKAKKESYVYDLIRKKTDVIVPEIYLTDDTMQLLPYAFTLTSKISGIQIDETYKKYHNPGIFTKAGEILAKIHTIKFPCFGWIMENGVDPSFSRWNDFMQHDMEHKLNNIMKVMKHRNLITKIRKNMKHAYDALGIKDRPCLLHKDYHCSHVLSDKDKITGIIDVEWAIAGHNENDFIKMDLWAFNKIHGVKEAFYNGYLNYGDISDDYLSRKKIYELWHWISMVNISLELKNKQWLNYNIKALQDFLK